MGKPDIGMVCETAPERIWLQSDPEPEESGKPVYTGDEVTWCADKINDTDTLYIRADLVFPDGVRGTCEGGKG